MSNSSGEKQFCTCASHTLLAALDTSPRAGDAALVRYHMAEIESRHRSLGVRRLTTSLPVCSGHWLFTSSEYRLPPAGLGIVVESVQLANPVQSIVTNFVTETQWAIFDDARRLIGREFRTLVAVSGFYSSLLSMFGPAIATCRGNAEMANRVVNEVRAAARRITSGRAGDQEFFGVANLMQILLREEACLAA